MQFLNYLQWVCLQVPLVFGSKLWSLLLPGSSQTCGLHMQPNSSTLSQVAAALAGRVPGGVSLPAQGCADQAQCAWGGRGEGAGAQGFFRMGLASRKPCPSQPSQYLHMHCCAQKSLCTRVVIVFTYIVHLHTL